METFNWYNVTTARIDVACDEANWPREDEEYNHRSETLSTIAGISALALEVRYKVPPTQLAALYWELNEAFSRILFSPEFVGENDDLGEEADKLCEETIRIEHLRILSKYVR